MLLYSISLNLVKETRQNGDEVIFFLKAPFPLMLALISEGYSQWSCHDNWHLVMKCLAQWMLKGELITAYQSVNSVFCSLLNVSFTLKCWRHGCQALTARHWQQLLRTHSQVGCDAHSDGCHLPANARPGSSSDWNLSILKMQREENVSSALAPFIGGHSFCPLPILLAKN